MTNLEQDPVINVITRGIRRDIDVLLAEKSLRGALVLLYSAIDTMAALAIPAGQISVTRTDFIAWADTYVRFPCQEQVTGKELYSARCAVLHTYSSDSDMTRAGACRRLGYMSKAVPEVAYNAKVDKDLVLVAVPGLRDAVFAGIDRFLVDAYADRTRAPLLEGRLKALLHELPLSAPTDGSTAAT